MLSLMKGRDNIQTRLFDPLKILRGPGAPAVCECGQLWLDEYLPAPKGSTHKPDPFKYLGVEAVGDLEESGLCDRCGVSVREVLNSRRESIWRSLREDFN